MSVKGASLNKGNDYDFFFHLSGANDHFNDYFVAVIMAGYLKDNISSIRTFNLFSVSCVNHSDIIHHPTQYKLSISKT